MGETPDFKGENLGLAPNSPTPLCNENLCILVYGLRSASLPAVVRRSEGQPVRLIEKLPHHPVGLLQSFAQTGGIFSTRFCHIRLTAAPTVD